MPRDTLQQFLQPNVVIGLAAIIAVTAVSITYLSVNKHPAAAWLTPTQGAITEEVDATGTVKPAESIDLSFQASGRIARVPVTVGQQVYAGQTLASLDAGDLAAALSQAKAALAVQQAKLQGIQAGATPSVLAASQTSVSNAQNSVLQGKQSVIQAATDAYVKSDDAIHNKVDQFITNARGPLPTLALTLNNPQLAQNVVDMRVKIENILVAWHAYTQSLPTDPNAANMADIAATTRNYTQEVGSYLDTVAAALNGAVPTANTTASIIQGYQANVATGRTNVSTSLVAFNAAVTAEASAESGLATAQAALNVTSAPATATDVAAQQAAVAAAQAGVDAAEANLGKTVISAPIAGTITVNDAHAGATAAPGAVVISMDSNGTFQMESFVSQTDYAKLHLGDSAQVTLDAYPDTAPLSAHVIEIDPAATMQNGVSSYKITLQFDTDDERLKAGLTGNIKVATAQKTEALRVPTSAVITQGSAHFVMKQTANGQELAPVTLGLSSADGFTEITSGLSAEDHIRAFGAE